MLSTSRDSTNGTVHNLAQASQPRLSDVAVHRRSAKGEDAIRIVLELPAEEGLESLESWNAVLTTPELRKEWDPSVDSAHIVETCFDPHTRLTKTNYTLGWPAKFVIMLSKSAAANIVMTRFCVPLVLGIPLPFHESSQTLLPSSISPLPYHVHPTNQHIFGLPHPSYGRMFTVSGWKYSS